MPEPVDPQEYARMRAIATELWPLADHLEGFWGVEIGAAGPFVMMSPAGRHESIVYRVVRQLEDQIPRTHPDTDVIAQSGAEIEDPSIGRMRRPDAVVVPLRVLDESEGTVDAGAILAVVEVVSKNNPDNDYIDKVADYPAMGIPHYLLVDPRKGLVFTYEAILPGPDGPRYDRVRDYVFGDTVPFGPWRIDTSAFRRYGS
ncbi:Uma2 family endonuclease [Streptacidiphilus jiangxiensis]|uniref:Putative restriction endonuclease n=1 Tax=Streptacidiphilus jiangxiensis TaxID=235985 RepID=A0A1H7YU97_STRJI|nr:Uma2 family endonuclease [Streptacidiphilus jiangxiensis]SEM48917.1 Putative restriction endonuclease [Streptacidiphilus jiangxiensis]